MKRIKQYLPILNWLPKYDRHQLQGDISAGLTVGVMLIPQGMAYAMIAGLPPIYGLYAATVPLIIYALLGTSRQLAVGPVAMVSLLTAAGVGSLAEGGTETYIALAITLAFMVGMIQFVLGVFRLGFLVNFLSHPVISGFTSAAALIIGLSQLKHLLGINLPRSHYIHEILWQAVQQFSSINWITVAIGLGGIVLIKGLKRINKAIPSALVVVIVSILVMLWGNLHAMGVKILGEIPQGLPAFSLPILSLSSLKALLPSALAIALISFMESIAIAKAIQRKHRDYKIIANQELIALGLANVGGAFFQSYPTTGGFSRTAVNDQAGAKTGIAALISVTLILLTLMFFTTWFYYLPKAVLASIIMVAVFGLMDFKEAKHLWRTNRTDFWMLAVTFVATLALGIELGIGVGVLLSLAVVIYKTSRPHIAELGQVPNSRFYRNVNRFEQIHPTNDLLIFRFDAQLFFANVAHFKDYIEAKVIEKGAALKAIIINAESINQIDSSGVHTLEELIRDYRNKGILIYFTGVKGPVRDVFEQTHFTEKVGRCFFFMDVQAAVDAYAQHKMDVDSDTPPSKFGDYVLQTNVN